MSSADPTTTEPPAAATEPPVDARALQRRARLGVVVLALRTVLQQLATLGGQIFLARILDPADFGAFWITQFAVSFFTIFGDAGLGPALIQKKEPPTQRELSTVFWIQLAIGLAVVAVVFVAAPWVVRLWPELPPSAPWLLRALSLEFLFVIVRVLPSILMERELHFARLSAIDVALSVSFYLAAVPLAALGWRSFALAFAVIVQGVVGVVLAYALRPWAPSFVFDGAGIGKVMRFGVVLQAKGIVSFLNGAVTPIYGGRVLGPYRFGLVSWSQDTGWFPLKLVELLGRVNYPLLARLQHDRAAFATTLSRTLRTCALATFFFIGLFTGLAPALVRVIYGDHWVPAIPTLYVYAGVLGIGFVSPIVGPALDAIGRPDIFMRLTIGWTIVNWIAVVVATRYSPTPMGFALGYAVHVLVGNAAVVWIVGRLLPGARLGASAAAAIVAMAASAAVGRFALLPFVHGPLTLVPAVLASAAVFGGVAALLDRAALVDLWNAARGRRDG